MVKTGGSTLTDNARAADFAVISNRMLIALLRMTWRRRYRQMKKLNFGSALELMLVSMTVTIGTREPKPFTASQIAKRLDMPRSNVVRRLEQLEKTGTVSMVKHGYVTDLDYLDSLVNSRAYVDSAIDIIRGTLTELEQLRLLLHDRMTP